MEDLYKKRDDKLRAVFNGVAADYEEYRLSYPEELFEDIKRYVGHPQNALEIGIGTGKATAPFLKEGIIVTAVEPNEKMAEIARNKNALLGALKILNGNFEDFTFEHEFDLVYAASSFQWLKSDDRMKMIWHCLKPNGTFAKFKTVTIINPLMSEGGKVLFDIYNKLLPEYLPRERKSKHTSREEFEKSGFLNLQHKEYYKNYFFDANRYIKFMNTYTEYIALDENEKERFERTIVNEVREKQIVITQKCTLDLATATEN